MDRRTILTVVMCFLVLVVWQKFYIEPHFHQSPPPNAPQSTSEVKDESTLSQAKNVLPPSSSTIPTPATQQRGPAEKLILHTGTGDAQIADEGNFFLDWTLKSYKVALSPQASAVDMRSVTNQEGEVSLAFDDPHFTYLNTVQGKLVQTPQGAHWDYEDQNVKISRVMSSSENQLYIDMQLITEFKTKIPRYAFISLTGQGIEKDPEAQDRQLVYWTNDSIERIHLKDNIEQRGISTPVKYIAISNRYFLMTIVATSPTLPNGLVQPTGLHAGRISLVYPVTGKTFSIPARIYFGPKEINILRTVEPQLDHSVDFGMFTIIAYPLLNILKWLYQFFQNYGVAIILLTLLLKVLTFPLTYKSMKSMKNMAKLQPQLQKIRERYKDDREALNREMLILMKNHGYNPAAGCLPVLIQMPIFFALYRVLYSSIDLYHAPFALWIRDLSAPDHFYVTPVLLSITMFIQQKLTPTTATDPAQAKMMQLMPIIFGAFMIALPSGLTLYMLVNALASIVQQAFLNKKFETTPATR